MPRRNGYWLCLMLFCLSACTTVPGRDAVGEAGPLPAAWTALPASVAQGQVGAWLASFNDDDVKSLVLKALEGNNDLKATATRVEQARAQARIEGVPAKRQPDLTPVCYAVPQDYQRADSDAR